MEEDLGYASFVVTLWLERGKEGETVWRGRLRHVQSGRAYSFTNLTELQALLERLAGASLPLGPPPERDPEG